MEKIGKKLLKVLLPVLSAAVMVFSGCSGPSKESGADLENGFMNPPESAKPRVWWHWMNGNISKAGIRADLEWFKRTGIGGFQNFDAGLATPQIVEKRLIYMTPEWKDAFLFTTRLADSLGLEMAIAGSPGWSESGGPWVTPAQAMKKFVWSEVWLDEGKQFSGVLPKPPSTTGQFQNIPLQRKYPDMPEFYADALVIAYRIPLNDKLPEEMNPKITSSAGRFELSYLTDGDLSNSVFLPAAKTNDKAWIQFEFANPVTIHSLTLVSNETGINYSGSGRTGNNRLLEASDNGGQFIKMFEIPSTANIQRTYTFTPVTGKFFRISYLTPEPPPRSAITARSVITGPPPPPPPPPGVHIAELVLHQVARVNRFEDKACFSSASGLYDLATPAVSAENVVKKSDIIDLTSKMQPDGTLDWTPPAGRWKIIRFGYSLTGHQNSPASPEATGLEVDKLDADHVKAYFDNYLDQYKDATGGLMGKHGLQFIITDSWEAGVQNWTDSMIVEFSRHRGYDPIPWMPVLTGQIVESAEASDRFLWDFRKTIADLTAENHYDQLTSILHKRDMKRYTESHEGGRAFIGDGMEVKRTADIPMSATWTPRESDRVDAEDVATRYKADVLESASVSHIYGQNLVAAESMTARGNSFAYSPERLKPTADMEMAMGLNRFVIHTSVHQPVSDKKPGLGLGPYGQWFTRHETWAEQAKPWITYLARSSFMLQQGKNIADILYYYGEDNNITALFGNKLPDIPEGYRFDFINADALVNVINMEKGRIVAPSGTDYQLLILDPNSQNMSLPVLKKIRSLVEAGATVAGPMPIQSPSLSDDQSEFRSEVNQLWINNKGENNFGRGKIYAGQSVTAVLASLKLAPDFKYTNTDGEVQLLFIHRRMSKADIYWVKNRKNLEVNTEAMFRIEGKVPEIWHPVTGKISPVSYVIENGYTRVPLKLEPNDAVFVVFRTKAKESSLIIPLTDEKMIIAIPGPWKVSFQPQRGAPSEIIMDNLYSWSENADKGVKYFSGTAAYTKTIEADKEWFNPGDELWLDLGDVKNIAEVIVNGVSQGIVWKSPFRVNLTDVLNPGDNSLEIKVTNLWVNRLIGDQQPGTAEKYTYTTMPFYEADSPLLPSGLLGPVQILSLSVK